MPSDSRRILITLPWADCPSNILLRTLIDDAHAADVAWLTDGEQPVTSQPFRFERVAWNFQPFGTFRAANSIAFRLRLYRVAEAATYDRRVQQAADQLADIIRKVSPDALWGVATPNQIVVLDRLLERVDVPLHLTVHDDPESAAHVNSCWPHALARAADRAWPRVLKRATSIDTVSNQMRDYIRARHGRDSIVLPPTPTAPLTDSPPAALDQHLRLGISGSWCNLDDSLLAFGQGLKCAYEQRLFNELTLSWLDGQRALQHRTPREVHSLLPPDAVQFLPRLAESDAIRTLAGCHVNYLTFWYPDKVLRQTSNPSKLRLFLPAARPIIIHGPDDCMPVQFAREHGIGVVWNNLNPTAFPGVLEQALRQLEDWPALHARYLALANEQLSVANNRALFWTTMDATCRGQRTASCATACDRRAGA
ncbi:MAG TPA: hypothetical protein VHY91_26070 [Pirellulales bacterium]|jgi:hypothetical protein|nr:hypothetical protein [Pirellulales bacterium]